MNFPLKYPISSVIVLGICILSFTPIGETPLSNVSSIDKWTHFAMYSILTLSIWLEYHHTKKGKMPKWRHLAFVGVLFPVCLGGIIELGQAYLTTYRSGEWYDFLANTLGVILGCCIGFLYYHAIMDRDK